MQETHCGWPLRNSKVFHAMNVIMERCNDLMELVHTIRDFRWVIGCSAVNESLEVEKREESFHLRASESSNVLGSLVQL